MKNIKRILICPFVIMAIALFLVSACKKDDGDNSGTVKDIDGNVYHTVKIGTQVWMVENLRVTHYRNGEPIEHVTDQAGGTPETGDYFDYDNDGTNADTYGRLYNWYAIAESPVITPAGWHVPSDAEWTTLITYLGGEDVAGGKLKESGTNHWNTPNLGATNESGFTALPVGYRDQYGVFGFLGLFGTYWSTSEADASKAWDRFFNYANSTVQRGSDLKTIGVAVRCIKD
jgi:uncharacterized protein (TIGR02145 family)